MNSYKYTAMTSSGEKVTGMIEAVNQIDATTRIRQQYDMILNIKELQSGSVASFLSADLGGSKLNNKEFTLMCNQLATILAAGIPIARAIRLIAQKVSDKTLHKILTSVGEDVEAGRSVSASFEEHGGKLFPVTFIETIRAGEAAGDLAGAFDSMARHFDKQAKMGAKVRAAMGYPVFVLIVAVVVVMVLMVKVVPTFTAIFKDLGAELPLMTRVLIAISDFFRENILYMVIILAAIIVAFILYKRTPSGNKNLARLQLKLPILGNIATLNAASLFANTMATMIGAGLPMTRAVQITSQVMTNDLYKEKVEGMVTRIEEGHTVVDSMRETEIMPDILTDMVGVGEETGEMKHTLDLTAEYYDNELETAVQSAISKLEPSLLIFVAVVAGFIVIAIYMAMFSMYGSM